MATKALAKLNEFLVSIRTRSQSETWATFFIKVMAIIFAIGGFWLESLPDAVEDGLPFSWVDMFQIGMIIYVLGLSYDIREKLNKE